MKRALYILALAFMAGFSAGAQETKTFSWVAPTTYVNGAPLPASEIAGYTISCATRTLTVNGPVTSFSAEFEPGIYVCSAVTRATNGEVSNPSNTVSFSVAPPRPNAPAVFSVD
jgi:hypothetical protein